MGEWAYRLPSDVRVSLRAPKRPLLLDGFLGRETSDDGPATLLLDLAPGKDDDPGGSLAVGRTGRSVAIRGVYKAIPWSCRVSERSDGGWTAGFRSPLQRDYLALHIVLIPLLRRLLLDRGVAVVSGAAFEREGGATLLAGPTGQGKTALLLAALERGALLVGDEYLGLRQNGSLVAVGGVVALRSATFGQAPGARERLGGRRKAALRMSRLVSLVTAGRLEPLVHVSPLELGLPTVSRPQPPVRRFFWLEPGVEQDSSVGCEAMAAGEAAGRLAVMQAAHDLWYGDLGALFDALRGRRGEDEYGSRWRDTVERGLADVACCRLAFPAREGMRQEVLDHVLSRGQHRGA